MRCSTRSEPAQRKGTMTTILGISGSLRSGSFNTALLRAAAELAPPGVALELATLHGIPLYDGDVESASGIPRAVAELKERIARADGLCIATPEYNGSIPGVLKNAIDWLSRPTANIAGLFRGRPVALLGATLGRGGTSLAQAAWLPVLRALGLQPWFGGRLQVSLANEVFGSDGRLKDERVRGELQAFVTGFAAFAARGRG
jgi:NAD(P)H-dependent FMN reductase